MGEVTLLLEAARQGGTSAIDRLFELLQPELKRIAHARLRHRDDRLLLETGAVVNETYLRLLGMHSLTAADRVHFLAYAARAMRSVVVDMVREQQALRRGGGACAQVTLDTAILDSAQAPGETEIVRVHEALQELAQIDERLVRVVEMRYFVGLSNEEVAASLGITSRTVERDWQKARSFLYRALRAD